MVANEVRKETYGVDWLRLRSRRDDLAWIVKMVVVEVWRRRKAAEGREGGKRRRKSNQMRFNNPHLNNIFG